MAAKRVSNMHMQPLSIGSHELVKSATAMSVGSVENERQILGSKSKIESRDRMAVFRCKICLSSSTLPTGMAVASCV